MMNYAGQHCWWWGPGYFFGGPMGMIIGILFWALIISGIFYLIKTVIFSSQESKEIPLEILKRKYASGEINSEEFELKKNNLSKN